MHKSASKKKKAKRNQKFQRAKYDYQKLQVSEQALVGTLGRRC